MIKDIEIFSDSFGINRNAYSSRSIFVSVLGYHQEDMSYDPESIGEIIFPDGFGTIDPPGPIDGFGKIKFNEFSNSNKISLRDLRDLIGQDGISEAINDFIDYFFLLDARKKKIIETDKETFLVKCQSNMWNEIHFHEFEPD